MKNWKKELHAFCIGNDGSDENWYKLSEPQLSVFIETLLQEEREKVVEEIRTFEKRLNWYVELTIGEHSVEEQLIVQNIHSDYINTFEKYLSKKGEKK